MLELSQTTIFFLHTFGVFLSLFCVTAVEFLLLFLMQSRVDMKACMHHYLHVCHLHVTFQRKSGASKEVGNYNGRKETVTNHYYHAIPFGNASM